VLPGDRPRPVERDSLHVVVLHAVGGGLPTRSVESGWMAAVGAGAIAVPHVIFSWRTRVEGGSTFSSWALSTFGPATVAGHYEPAAAGRATASLAYSRRFVRRSNRSHSSFVQEAVINRSGELSTPVNARSYVTRTSVAPHFSHDWVRRTCVEVASHGVHPSDVVVLTRAPREQHRQQRDRWGCSE
jgi:hypothetical protein